MCEQCDQIEEKIAQYKRLRNQIADRQTLDAAERLLIELAARKAALHCESAR
jgi:uncharacterized protein YlaI